MLWSNRSPLGTGPKTSYRCRRGIIDQDYHGNLNVILYNHSDIPFTVSRGDRIAQLICEKIYYPTLEEVKLLDITERGERGFGSTGKN